MSEWREIATHPMESGKEFLAVTADGRMMIWSGPMLKAAMADTLSNHLRFPATHWMPLPDPPQQKAPTPTTGK